MGSKAGTTLGEEVDLWIKKPQPHQIFSEWSAVQYLFPSLFFSAKRSLNLIKPGEADLTKPQTRKSLKNSDLQTFPILCWGKPWRITYISLTFCKSGKGVGGQGRQIIFNCAWLSWTGELVINFSQFISDPSPSPNIFLLVLLRIFSSFSFSVLHLINQNVMKSTV